MEHIFRAYDVRGIFNEELYADTAARIGMSFGTYLGCGGKVLVGRDSRVTSTIIENAFCSGLASTDIDVYSTGMVPIPVANFKTMRGAYNAGAYITASHNPPEYNGVRFRRSDGTGFTRENEEVRDIFLGGEVSASSWREVGGIYRLDKEATLKEYCEYLLPRFNPERSLKVVCDSGNGTASLTSPYLFSELGFQVKTLNAQPDGTFPGRESEPKPESLGDLMIAVRDFEADFGVAFDGDADRAVFVDDLGRVVQNEKIGVLVAREILREKGGGKVVANVECSSIVEKEITGAGGEVARVRVGDVFVSESLKRHGALFGIETSAHYFYPELYYFDDPLAVSLKLGEILSKSGKRLSEMADSIPSYPKASENYPCDDRTKFEVMERIVERFRAQGYPIDTTDGARISFEYGWALLRPSNTTPLLRATVEARDRKRLEELLSLVKETFEEAEKEVQGYKG